MPHSLGGISNVARKKKKKEPVFQGPTRPQTDVATFRRTGVSDVGPPTRENAARLARQQAERDSSVGGRRGRTIANKREKREEELARQPKVGAFRVDESNDQNPLGTAFAGLQAEARASIDPRLLKAIDVTTILGDVAALFIPGPAGKGFGGIKKVAATLEARGAEEAARLGVIDRSIDIAIKQSKEIIVARDKYLRGTNLNQVWANLVPEEEALVAIGRLPGPTRSAAVVMNTKNKKLIEKAVAIAWGDRSTTFRN